MKSTAAFHEGVSRMQGCLVRIDVLLVSLETESKSTWSCCTVHKSLLTRRKHTQHGQECCVDRQQLEDP